MLQLKIRRSLAVVPLAVLGMAFAVPAMAAEVHSGASGAPGDNASCTLTGNATITSFNGVASPPGIPVPPAGANKPGTYSFTSVTGMCAIADPGETPNSEVTNVNIASNGSLLNVACGTGTASSTTVGGLPTTGIKTPARITAQTPPDAQGELPADLNYTIAFANGVGTLSVIPNAVGTGASNAHADDGGAGDAAGGGVIDILPLPNSLPGNPPPPVGTGKVGCVNAPADGFSVIGTVNVTFTEA